MSAIVDGVPVDLDPDPKMVNMGYIHDVLVAEHGVASLKACYNVPAVDPAVTTLCTNRDPCHKIECLWCAFRCGSESFFDGLRCSSKESTGCRVIERS